MTEPLQVGQFAIVDHEPVDRGPNAGIFHGRGPVDDRAELYIVAEGTTPAGEGFAGHVVSAVGHTWSGLDLSLTGALRRVFAEADRNLRDWNQKSIAQHRVSIGLTCLGHRGDQAVIAQAGPSVAFHLHDGQVRAYYSDEEHGHPIGMGGSAEPQLTRLPFGPNDRLLLCSTAALRELDDDLIAGIITLPTDQVLPDLYRRLRDLRHLTALLVTATPAPALRAQDQPGPGTDPGEYIIGATGHEASLPALPPGPAPATAPETGYQPSLFIDEPGEPARVHLRDVTPRSIAIAAPVPDSIVEIPMPLRRAAGDSLLAALAADRQMRITTARAASHAAAMGAANAGGHSNTPAWRTAPANAEVSASGAEQRRRRGGSFSRGLVREEAPPRPNTIIDLEPVPLVDEMAAEVRANAALASYAPSGVIGETIASENAATVNRGGSLVRVRDDMGGRWKAGGSLSGRRPVAAGQLPPTWLVIIVGLGILLALVAAFVVPGMVQDDGGNRYDRLVNDAQKRFATSRVEQDPTERRKALTDAQALILEARDADPVRTEAVQLLAQVNADIAQMDAIRTPAAVDAVADLSQFGNKPVAPSRLTIGNDRVYILDNASFQVIAVTIANGEKTVAYAEDKDAKRGRPVATAWIESGDIGRDTLLVLDAGKSLWAYSSAGLRQISFAAPSGLNATDIAVRGRDLYVLDANEAVVYRFAPGDGGFGLAPTKYLSTPDLAAARRLLVDDEIITSDANGTVRRFFGQMSLVLSEAGIDKKVSGAEPPQAIGANGDIAILDAAADRIVVFRRDGTFDRQYRHKDFQGLVAFAARNGTGYLFTSSGHLRRVSW